MLSLSSETRQLLNAYVAVYEPAAAGDRRLTDAIAAATAKGDHISVRALNELAASFGTARASATTVADVLIPSIPLHAHTVSVLGRCDGLAALTHAPVLIREFKRILVEEATKIRGSALLPAEFDAVVKSTPWIGFLEAKKIEDIRYVRFSPPTHPAQISFFQVMVMRVPASPDSGYRWPFHYHLLDTGSLYGVYVDDQLVARNTWVSLREGAAVRFGKRSAPQLAALRALQAGASIASLPRLHVRDLFPEFVFTHAAPCGAAATAAAVATAHEAVASAAAARRAALAAAAPPPPPPSPSAGQKRSHGEKEGAESASKRARTEGEQPTAAAAAAASSSSSSSSAAAAVTSMAEETMCGICLETIVLASSIRCGHSFCHTCISKWFKPGRAKACPSCRTPHTGEVTGARSFDAVIGSIAQQTMTAEELAAFRKRTTDAVAAIAAKKAAAAAKKAAKEAKVVAAAAAAAAPDAAAADAGLLAAQHQAAVGAAANAILLQPMPEL